MKDHQQPPATGEPNSIARSVMAKAQWSRRAVSPWVQRSLQSERAPGPRGAAAQSLQLAVSAPGTSLLLKRVQRLAERGTAQRSGIGSVQPAAVQRFTDKVVDRYPETGSKYEAQSLQTKAAETDDLVLAGGVAPSSEPEVEEYKPEPSGEVLAKLREAFSGRTDASATESPASSVQRTPTRPQIQPAAESPTPDRPARKVPPRARLFSRVEMVSSSKGPQPPSPAQAKPVQRVETKGAEEELAQAKPLQRVEEAAEEEEPVQAQRVQRVEGAAEEEEPVQAQRVQRVEGAAEEEEPVQAQRVQRVEGAAEEEEPVQAQRVQRVEEGTEEELPLARRVQPATTKDSLQKSVLDRAALRSQMPLATSRVSSAQRFAQRQTASQKSAAPWTGLLAQRQQPTLLKPTEPAKDTGNVLADDDKASLPLHTLAPATKDVQREPDGEFPGSTGFVQRAESDETVVGQQSEGIQSEVEKVDLDRLARDIYPLIKRMLSVERERRIARY